MSESSHLTDVIPDDRDDPTASILIQDTGVSDNGSRIELIKPLDISSDLDPIIAKNESGPVTDGNVIKTIRPESKSLNEEASVMITCANYLRSLKPNEKCTTTTHEFALIIFAILGWVMNFDDLVRLSSRVTTIAQKSGAKGKPHGGLLFKAYAFKRRYDHLKMTIERVGPGGKIPTIECIDWSCVPNEEIFGRNQDDSLGASEPSLYGSHLLEIPRLAEFHDQEASFHPLASSTMNDHMEVTKARSIELSGSNTLPTINENSEWHTAQDDTNQLYSTANESALDNVLAGLKEENRGLPMMPIERDSVVTEADKSLPNGEAMQNDIIDEITKALQMGTSEDIQDVKNGFIHALVCRAAKMNNIAMLEHFKAMGVLDLKGYNSRTALHVAASSGNTEATKFLLQNGVNVHAKDMSGLTPLKCAVDSASMECIEAIRVAGGVIDGDWEKMGMEMCFSAARGDLNMIKSFAAAGYDLNATDYDGRGALHLAVTHRRTDLISFLLQSGSQTDLKDRFGRSPFDEAAHMGWEEGLEMLKAVTSVVHVHHEKTPKTLRRRTVILSPSIRLLVNKFEDESIDTDKLKDD